MRKYFRFLNLWTKYKYFQGIVQENWSGNIQGCPFQVVHEKLKRLKKALAGWNRQTFGDIFQNVATLEDVVKVKEAQLEIQPTPQNREKLSKPESNLKRVRKIEKEYWKRKTGMK